MAQPRKHLSAGQIFSCPSLMTSLTYDLHLFFETQKSGPRDISIISHHSRTPNGFEVEVDED